MSRIYHELSFQSPGPPSQVLKYQTSPDSRAKPTPISTTNNFIQVDMLYAPWNPADANTVQGTYASPYYAQEQKIQADQIRESAHFEGFRVAGSEGIGRIAAVAGSVGHHHQVGDWVALGQPGLGTMRSSLWLPHDAVVPLHRGEELVRRIGAARAAMLVQVGGTALRMLRDFVHLTPGSVVLQNAGNSAVAFVVSQLVGILFPNVFVVSLVRRGQRSAADYTSLVNYLTTEGRNHVVVAEEDLKDQADVEALTEKMKQLSDMRPQLALNAVGGDSSAILLNLLGPGGTMVTYGGLSTKPVAVATPYLIYKDVRLRGYWQSRWMVQHSVEDRAAMANELVDCVLRQEGEVLTYPPVEVFSLSEFQAALDCNSSQSHKPVRSKIVFDCRADLDNAIQNNND